jgi:hypothetical protein
MGQVIKAWGSATEGAVNQLFNGSEPSIQALTKLISNGRMTPGDSEGHPVPKHMSDTQLQDLVTRVFYSYTIPAIWTAAALSVFIMDSGFPCDDTDPITPEYMYPETAHATRVCHNNKRYYLARATEAPGKECDQDGCGDVGCVPSWSCYFRKFAAPPGVDKLGSVLYGNVTLDELVSG